MVSFESIHHNLIIKIIDCRVYVLRLFAPGIKEILFKCFSLFFILRKIKHYLIHLVFHHMRLSVSWIYVRSSSQGVRTFKLDCRRFIYNSYFIHFFHGDNLKEIQVVQNNLYPSMGIFILFLFNLRLIDNETFLMN